MKALQLAACLAIALGALTDSGFAQAPERQYRVGVLTPRGPLPDTDEITTGFLKELGRHGFKPGRNLVLERRGAEGRVDRLPGLVRDLVSSKVDVILATGYPAIRAAKEGTSTVPIVLLFGGDPVETGVVRSLARPGGNVTGVSDVASELSVKRLELLKEMIPGLRRIAMLWNADDFGMTLRYRAAAAVADSFGVVVQALGVREPEDFEAAFSAMTREAPDAILMVSDSLTNLNRRRVYDFAATHRLPAIYEFKYYARDGGLISYGPDQTEAAARAGGLAARILKGAKPVDLPVEQPTKYELVVNLKTANTLGLDIPQSILLRADEVIE